MLAYGVHLLMLCSMLWHAIGGCCVDHLHHRLYPPPADHSVTEDVPTHECDAHRHKASGADDRAWILADSTIPEDSRTPCDRDHDCRQGGCVFIKTAPPAATAGSGTIAEELAGAFLVSALTQTASRCVVEPRARLFGVETSLRRCARMQTWRI
jgi:hypothetical protein